ncbi:GntR family transcriptional regulator [Anaerorhabdus sp.]|uniref:GntR family transcriptional regulator n=1 Tax=Anaerorhabdus sp. TaxID=1872524 RepID=UPI002FCA1C94
MNNFKADKNSSVPIHHQLYLYIKDLIESGEFSEGESLPSENEMIKLYEISRITIRRAISDLEHDGLVLRRRGSGTVVQHIKKQRTLSQFSSFSGDAKVKGDKPGSIILKIEKMEAGVKVGEKLNIASKSQIYFIKRLRLLNGKLIALHETYVRSDLGFSIKNSDFDTNTSLYEFLEEHGIKLGSADETIEAKMSSSEVKRDLFLEDNQPVIYKERVTFDQNGKPIEFSENTYIADSYKYYVHIVNVRGDSNETL